MMSSSRPYLRLGRLKPARAMALAVAILPLAACSSVVDLIPEKAGGLPAGTPQRAADPPAYPTLFHPPPPRPTPPLTAEERKKLEAELAATRDEQAKRASAPTVPAKNRNN